MIAFRKPLRGFASRAACAGMASIMKITEIRISLDIEAGWAREPQRGRGHWAQIMLAPGERQDPTRLIWVG